MIPSLVLIRSNKKRLVTLTRKRTLKIGADQDCDVIVNHPHLHKHPQVLGPGSTRWESRTLNNGKISFFLSDHSFNIEGLHVRMVHLKILFNILLIAFIGIAAATCYLTDHSVFSISQDWTPITLPANPALPAAMRLSRPLPQPMSSTVEPSEISAKTDTFDTPTKALTVAAGRASRICAG